MIGQAPEVLAVAGLGKAFGRLQAVAGVSLAVAAGELVAMIGPNGAGKSTCFNLINGQLQPDTGTIRLCGADITGLPPRQVWRRGVGRTFQIAAAFGSMTVMENLQVTLISHPRRLGALWPRARDLYRAQAMALLDRVAMADQAERQCGVLAYGDVKRVELAIALATEPRLLLMDEPTSGMAPSERAALMELTAGIARTAGIAVLFTEHDMDVVFGHADRVLVLDRGALIAEGAPAAVRDDPKVRDIYLGAAPGNMEGGPC